MSSLNSVTIIGNLGADPEMRYTTAGKAVCELRVAVNEKRGGQDKTEWFSVTCWEKTAESCAQYLKKGRSVCVQGRLETQTWDDKKTGEKKYKTIIVASNVVFLGGGDKSERGESRSSGGYGDGRKSSGHDAPPSDFDPPPNNDDPGGVPF
jgi:single-strand DNA-binding protein